ncbi:MAG TPA: MarR family transcriptional regulator [Bacteroidota bacterium]|nr:MarR family transcriptional regulator [Bacteroidota bacterium]
MKSTSARHAKELVEKIGIAVEKAGFQPAVGRVLASLLVSDPPYRTFDDIQRFLGISKSAVSTALNALMAREMVDYITLPGDRKRYFQLAAPGLISQMKRKIGLHSALPELLREVVKARSNKYPEFNRSLLETIEFISFMEKEISAAIEKWETLKLKKS